MTKQRLSLVLPERSMERLERLKDRTDAASVAEVIRNAVMTYESIVNHLSQGATFTVHQPNGEVFDVEFLIDVPKIKPHLRLVDPETTP